MNRQNLSRWLSLAISPLLALSVLGCAFRVVRPPPLIVGSAESGELRVVKYPAYVLVHDSESFWDGHQIKDNFAGVTEFEIVHGIDLVISAVTPGPALRPLENGIEWIKNSYAQLPDCAPVRIVDGLFSALEIEKLTVFGGIQLNPTNPASILLPARVIYLTAWVHETLGEVNRAAGYLAPWPGTFIPQAATAPVNKAVKWAQSGAISLFICVFREVNLGLDHAIDGGEAAWAGIVGIFVKR